jgi:uncharacterized protein
MTDTPPPAAAPAAPLSEADDRQWASFAHLGGIIGILPSLIIYLVFKDRGAFTREESKEALNFQITLAIAQVVLFILAVALAVILIGFLFSFLQFVVWVLGVVFSIMGFLKTKDGVPYRYPFALRLIK